MQFRTEHKFLVAFSHASLTDVVLQLLIFFLLSSSLVIQSGIKVQLPRALNKERGAKEQIVVGLTRDGAIYLNGQQIPKQSLQAALSPLLQTRTERMVVIQADRDVSLQNTVDVMDIAKSAGAVRFLIATQPVE